MRRRAGYKGETELPLSTQAAFAPGLLRCVPQPLLLTQGAAHSGTGLDMVKEVKMVKKVKVGVFQEPPV